MSQAKTSAMRQRIGLITGLVIAVGLQVLPVPEGLDRSAWLLASLALMMAAWSFVRPIMHAKCSTVEPN